MSPGACDACILRRECCGSCWCCPWPSRYVDPAKVLPVVVRLVHDRPELAARGWDGERVTLARVLADGVTANA